uniref:Dual oxidase 2 n=1 Tax=Denticeps clupeoides TaxID=299321 RepID=A0AAY4B3X3_9TELE
MTFYNDIYPFYPLQRTSFIFSTNLLTVILVFLVLAAAFLLILPGIRGKSVGFERLALHRSIYREWLGHPVRQLNETIDYNEMFQWTGKLDDDYADALERGLPNPILYIAEKFTTNSPCGLIYQYRYSGRFASATLWTAFCCWLLANILFSMPVILYAGYMMLATAAFIFSAMASFSTIYNLPQCSFTIGTETFQTIYSHSFWLALATGTSRVQQARGPAGGGRPCMKEAFSVGVDGDDDDMYLGAGYLNSSFLTEVSTDGVMAKGRRVDPLYISKLSVSVRQLHSCTFCVLVTHMVSHQLILIYSLQERL